MSEVRRNRLSKKVRLATEIDLRAHNLTLSALETFEDEHDQALVLAYIRAAYAAGYTDCMKEPANKRGDWFQKIGYKI